VDRRNGYIADPTRRPMGDGHDLRARRADGSTIPVDISLSPVTIDDDRYVMAAVRDATERREHHRQITRLRKATRRLMEAETTEEVAELVATAATTLFGYESSVFRLVEGGRILRPIALAGSEKIGLDDRPGYPIDEGTPVTRAYERGEPIRHDDVRDLEDGYDRGDARAAMYVPIGDYGVLSVLDRDVAAFDRADLELASSLAANAETILDRLRHERELERQIERLDEFSGVVSHDLLNPLNVARGQLELAMDGHEQAELDVVDDALERMETIVESTLTLAKHGDVVGETEPVALEALARRCWNRVDTTHAQLHAADGIRVRGDRDRLEHVFENLFSNAIEHGTTTRAEPDDPAVTIRVDRLEDEPGFYIEDDGHGIPESERDSIFDTGYTNSADGTGFGLAIVRQIVTAHGWRVRVTDGSDGGARFEFTDVEFV
jgi:signal transduction histidine kinase